MSWGELRKWLRALSTRGLGSLMREFEFPYGHQPGEYLVLAFMHWCLIQGQIHHLMARIEKL